MALRVTRCIVVKLLDGRRFTSSQFAMIDCESIANRNWKIANHFPVSVRLSFSCLAVAGRRSGEDDFHRLLHLAFADACRPFEHYTLAFAFDVGRHYPSSSAAGDAAHSSAADDASADS